MCEIFWDNESGGYFSTSGKDETILIRMKEGYDGAEPSPNSVALLNLLRLSQITNTAEHKKRAEQILQAFSDTLERAPHAMPQMMVAFDFYLDKPMQIIIAGSPESQNTKAMLREIHKHYIPNKILLLADGSNGQATLAKKNDFIRNLKRIENKSTAYICEDFTCRLPITELKYLADILSK